MFNFGFQSWFPYSLMFPRLMLEPSGEHVNYYGRPPPLPSLNDVILPENENVDPEYEQRERRSPNGVLLKSASLIEFY